MARKSNSVVLKSRPQSEIISSRRKERRNKIAATQIGIRSIMQKDRRFNEREYFEGIAVTKE